MARGSGTEPLIDLLAHCYANYRLKPDSNKMKKRITYGWDGEILSIKTVEHYRPGDYPQEDKKSCGHRKEWLRQYILYLEKEIGKLKSSIEEEERIRAHPRYVGFEDDDQFLIRDFYEKISLEASLVIAQRLLVKWLA